MSIHKSYFNRNNTLISNSFTNTGKNPVTELFYGNGGIVNPIGYSRFIFNLDLELLREKIGDGTIPTGCITPPKHILRMTNTSYFDKDLLNQTTSQNRLRATSFDLILFRIPYINYDSQRPQLWDEGVGYDFADIMTQVPTDKDYSDRPSNWFKTTTVGNWEEPGIYNNTNGGLFPYSGLTIIDQQHFEFGNEDVEFDMSNEINGILNGTIINPVGWGIAFLPQVELLTGTTGTYSVGFFTRHTQTFYEPFLETQYDDLITDNRNNFTLGKTNKLYLYIYEDGDFKNLDQNPVVTINDSSGNPIEELVNLPSCRKGRGIYEITIPPLIGYKTPCMFSDVWSGIIMNGFQLPNITNEFVIYPLQKSVQFGTTTQNPVIYGFDFFGIKQDEKILNTDVRKVGVIIKEAYTRNKMLPNVDGYYRIYVREGQTEVQVQDWTKLNKSPNEYYFMFDTRDKIPNEYFIDLKVISSGEVNTYKRTIKFQITNKK
jgi:hypothetical protein